MSPRISLESLPDRARKQAEAQIESDRVSVIVNEIEKGRAMAALSAKASASEDTGENKTERRYREHLESLKRSGVILDYSPHDAVTLKLARDTRYTPDFMVIGDQGVIEFHEVKGFWRDDARVKIKVAARLFPWFTFKSVSWKKKEWVVEMFRP